MRRARADALALWRLFVAASRRLPCHAGTVAAADVLPD